MQLKLLFLNKHIHKVKHWLETTQAFFNNVKYIKHCFVSSSSFHTDERYTWVLGPGDMAVDVGVYNLLIRPVVPPGVKSINASVTITSITAQCIFWEETRSNWSDYGCRVSAVNQVMILKQVLATFLSTVYFSSTSFFILFHTSYITIDLINFQLISK